MPEALGKVLRLASPPDMKGVATDACRRNLLPTGDRCS